MFYSFMLNLTDTQEDHAIQKQSSGKKCIY